MTPISSAPWLFCAYLAVPLFVVGLAVVVAAVAAMNIADAVRRHRARAAREREPSR